VKIQAQIDALERLAAIDAELKVLMDQLQSERDELSRKKQMLGDLEAKLARDRQSVEEMERMRNDLVVELRQMGQQIEKSREKLARCRTEREANAAQREVEELRKLYRDREVEIDKLSALVDQAHQEIEATTAEKAALAGELGQTEGETANRLGDVESLAASKEAARKEVVSQVQPALYRRYELVRKRRGTALAYTSEGTCSGCHMLLPPMLYQKLRRSEELDQCPSCHRILYFRADASPGETAQPAEGRTSGP
jgi:predicted  nucleic acid-binding Zn-ribbon protein